MIPVVFINLSTLYFSPNINIYFFHFKPLRPKNNLQKTQRCRQKCYKRQGNSKTKEKNCMSIRQKKKLQVSRDVWTEPAVMDARSTFNPSPSTIYVTCANQYMFYRGNIFLVNDRC